LGMGTVVLADNERRIGKTRSGVATVGRAFRSSGKFIRFCFFYASRAAFGMVEFQERFNAGWPKCDPQCGVHTCSIEELELTNGIA
jgi:hypothetical protein